MSSNPGMPGPANPNNGRIAPGVGLPALLTAFPTALCLIRSLRRCWLRAVCLGLVLATTVGAATWYLLPPSKVTARTILRLDPNNKFLFAVSQTNNLVEYQRTQIGLLKSRLVLSGALQNKKLGVSELATVQAQPDPVAWLEKEVSADFLVAQNLMRISMSGYNRNARDLETLVTAVRESYKENILNKERDERAKYLDKLTVLHREQQDKLNAKRKALEPLAEKAGGSDPTVRSLTRMFAQQMLAYLDKDWIQTRSELMKFKTQLEVKRAQENNLAEATVPQDLIEEELNKEPTYLKDKEAVAYWDDLITQHKARSQRPEATDTVLQNHRVSHQKAQQALEGARKRLTPEVTKRALFASRAEVVKAIRLLEVQIVTHEQNEKQLAEQVKWHREELERMANNGLRLDVDHDELTLLAGLTKYIADQATQLRVEIQNAAAPTEVIEETVILRPNEETRLILMTIAASCGTLVLVVLAFAFWEFRARRVGAVDDVSQGLGLNLMGTLPDSSARAYGARSKGNGDDGHSLLAEAVDATRTILLRSARTDGLRVVMVTSAHSGEGKTSLSTHLAASLAQVGYRTLFIDGDLRNPIAHRVFDMESEPGFCELLRGEAITADLIRQTPVDLLSMISAGRWDSEASRALGRDGFLGELLQPLRSDFDFVIIDSSPVLPVVDPLLIGQQADGTILSVLRDVSRMPSVYAAHQRLLAGGVKVLGAVVNGVRGEAYGATYYYRQRAGA